MPAELDAIKRAVARALNKDDFEFGSHRSIIDRYSARGTATLKAVSDSCACTRRKWSSSSSRRQAKTCSSRSSLPPRSKTGSLTSTRTRTFLSGWPSWRVSSWFKEIKNKFKGRFPNDICSLYQGVQQAVNLADAKRSDVARLLGTSSRLLKKGRARF